MEEKILRNMSSFYGTYEGEELVVYSTVATTKIIEGIEVTKTADKTLWANGPLTYTIVITNTTDVDFTLTHFIDEIDTVLVTLDTNSIKVNDVTTSSYTFNDSVLNVNIGLIPAGGVTTVSFQVLQA